jgi:hypothetical protein
MSTASVDTPGIGSILSDVDGCGYQEPVHTLTAGKSVKSVP